MKVLVFDICTSVNGHRIPYAGLVAKAFTEHEVVVALPDQVADEPILNDYFSDQVQFQFFETERQSTALADVRTSWRCLVQQIKHCQPDAVAVPTGDGLAFWGGVKNLVGLSGTGRVPIDIGLMKGHFRTASDSWLKKTVNNLKWWVVTKGPWRRVLLIDPRSFEDLKNPASQNVVLCPDPAPKQKFTDRHEARVALGLPTAGRMIVSVGNQEVRKGTDLLLQAFEIANLESDDFLVLMGRFDAPTRKLADEIVQKTSLGKHLVIRDTFVSDDQLQQAVVASNLVAVPYRDVERPSGIVSRSIAWGRPILATDGGWLKWFVKHYQAGYLTQPENTPQFAEDIKVALSKSDDFHVSAAADKFRTFNTELCYLDAWNNRSTHETLVNPVT